ncbi:MAG TPA: hypothetical protein VFR01_09490 [Geobacterales bacterium]|jgi:hypothetical protein|nr:hypothetical protein [Geobacterales bacterium]
MDHLTILLLVNLLLTLVDSSIGYAAAPALSAQFGGDFEEQYGRTVATRRTVTLMVAVDAAAAFLSHSWQSLPASYLIAAVLTADSLFGGVLFFRQRARS